MTAGKITRRTKGAALVLGAGLAVTALAGCGGGSTSTADSRGGSVSGSMSSSRMKPPLAKMSLTLVFFICASTLSASSEPVALTAFRYCSVAE